MGARRPRGAAARPSRGPGARCGATLLTLLVLAGGCGGDDEKGRPIPAERADDLIAQLEELERRVPGACNDAQFTLERIDSRIERLPRRVDAEVRDALEDGAARLRDLVVEDCDEQDADTTDETTEETTEETTTETTEETTEETIPDEPETDTAPTPPPEPPPPPPQPTPPPPPPGGGTPAPPGGGGGGTGGSPDEGGEGG